MATLTSRRVSSRRLAVAPWIPGTGESPAGVSTKLPGGEPSTAPAHVAVMSHPGTGTGTGTRPITEAAART